MDEELELLLSLDGAEYEMTPGVIVGFAVRRTKKTRATYEEDPAAPPRHQLRARAPAEGGGAPWVRFDNAHPIEQGGRRRKRIVYDHWHRTTKDEGRPYAFTTLLKLLDDFWQEVKRTLNEKGIPNDL